jgi:hypothetical protein
LALRALSCLAPTVVIYALTPHVGYLHDGQRYSEMAAHPFHADVGSPWSLRIAVPLLVHVLPFSQAHSFYGLAFLSSLVAGLCVAAVVSDLGLSEAHARAAAVLVCCSELTVISFWAYYIDIEMLALYAAAFLLSLRRRTWLLVPFTAGAVLVKEIGILIAPLAALVWGRSRRTLAIAGSSALAGLAVLVVESHLIRTRGSQTGIDATPTGSGVLHNQWAFTRSWLDVVWRFGVVRYGANAMLSVFGVAWLGWFAGWRAAPARLARSQWWILLALPLFVTAQWERSFALFLPLVVPMVMFGLRRWRLPELVLFTLGSAWVSGIAPTQTISDDAVTSAMTKLSWMSPGLAAAAAAGVLVLVRSRNVQSRIGRGSSPGLTGR